MTKVIFFGNERLVSGLEKTDAPILSGLIENGYNVVAIVSHYADSKSRNQRKLEVADIAESHNIPLFLPDRPSDILEELRAFNADIAVLTAYGRIVKQDVIDIFPKGIINIHPSLLPKYRGPTPIESAILNGDAITGVSIMHLSAGMDEGPVYAQREVALENNETKFTAYEKIDKVATSLFFDAFPKIIDGSLQAEPQDNDAATYSKLIDKSDGVIDWQKDAERLDREIRIYEGWPQSRTKFGTVEVIITKAHVEAGSVSPGELIVTENTLQVGTARDLLTIDSIKPLGKKEMPVTAFLSGYRNRLTV